MARKKGLVFVCIHLVRPSGEEPAENILGKNKSKMWTVNEFPLFRLHITASWLTAHSFKEPKLLLSFQIKLLSFIYCESATQSEELCQMFWPKLQKQNYYLTDNALISPFLSNVF